MKNLNGKRVDERNIIQDALQDFQDYPDFRWGDGKEADDVRIVVKDTIREDFLHQSLTVTKTS